MAITKKKFEVVVGDIIRVIRAHSSLPRGLVLQVTVMFGDTEGKGSVMYKPVDRNYGFMIPGTIYEFSSSPSYIEKIDREGLADVFKDNVDELDNQIKMLTQDKVILMKKIEWCTKYKTDAEGMADEVLQEINNVSKEEAKERLTKLFSSRIKTSIPDSPVPTATLSEE